VKNVILPPSFSSLLFSSLLFSSLLFSSLPQQSILLLVHFSSAHLHIRFFPLPQPLYRCILFPSFSFFALHKQATKQPRLPVSFATPPRQPIRPHRYSHARHGTPPQTNPGSRKAIHMIKAQVFHNYILNKRFGLLNRSQQQWSGGWTDKSRDALLRLEERCVFLW
jgi:hypothetical protein